MIFKNASVFVSGREFIKTDITVENGIITSTERTDAPGEDCTGKVILPGFIDIHIHGCNRADASHGSADEIETMSRFLAERGITSFCPTTMTLPESDLKKAFEAVKSVMGNEPGAYIHGINMEGPFISQAKKGAQAGEHIIPPDFDMFERLNAICPVKLADIAPETENAFAFIEKAKDICTVSAAHTAADCSTVKEAERHGLSHATHLFNAMTGLTSREPGAVGAVLDSDTITAELICDTIHISPCTLRLAFRLLGEDRSIVISDAMMAAGLEDGEYTLGGQRVIKHGDARLPDGTLAGSVTNLFEEFKNIISIGIPIKQAIKSVTINPARAIRADSFTGSIDAGKSADLIILPEDMSAPENVYIKGKKVK